MLGLGHYAGWLEQKTSVGIFAHHVSLVRVPGQHNPASVIGFYHERHDIRLCPGRSQRSDVAYASHCSGRQRLWADGRPIRTGAAVIGHRYFRRPSPAQRVLLGRDSPQRGDHAGMAPGPVVDDGLAGNRQLLVGLNIVEIAEATHDVPECLLNVRRLRGPQCLQKLPSHNDFREFAAEIGAAAGLVDLSGQSTDRARIPSLSARSHAPCLHRAP
jgi:hypothetical protein